MKKIITLILFLSLFLTDFKAGVSQNENLKVEHVSLEQGVSNNLVYSIFQDSKGFIWFGTMFGLVRYDGVNYKTYRHDPLDTNSLSNDDIVSIFEDKDGNLWFGTFNGGVNFYERKTNKFTRYLNDPENPNSISNNIVWVIKQDKDGVMWFATEGGGLNRFKNGKFYAYKHVRDTVKDNGTIAGNYVRSLETDKEGNVWAGTIGGGLSRLDKEKDIFINYRNDPKNENSLSNNYASSILADSEGALWVGTRGGGLNKFNPSAGNFTRFMNDPKDKSSIISNGINYISEDSPGVLLVATQKGLVKFNTATGKSDKISIYQGNTADSSNREAILTFIKDLSGVLWLSSYNEGLYKAQFTGEKFHGTLKGKNIGCILEDRSGRLWVGTDGDGLQLSEDGGKSYVSFFNTTGAKGLNYYKENKIHSIAEDKDGNIWVGSGLGLNRISKDKTFLKKYLSDPKDSNSVASNNILKVYFDNSGTLWIGTDYGLDRFDPANENFIHYRNSVKDKNSLSENTILSIYEDKKNELWIGTYFGLNKLNKATGTFKRYQQDPAKANSLSNNYVFSFCEDENNNFWIGTGGGLNIFDRKTETFFNFTEKDGLPNGVIAGLETGKDGYLWISTFKGISRFSVKNNEFKNYDSYDGLMSNMFNTGSYFKNSKGEIYFGSINGLNYFKPDELIEKTFQPPVSLTTLTRYNDQNKTEEDISSMDEIEFSYKDNMINIGFASMDFTNPEKNKFAYKLEGFDDNWNYSSDNNEAVYTNLNPGEYIFKVKGTNSDGVWNENEASINITITPPFWKTWWFYGILLAALTGGIIFIHNYRLRQKVKNMLEMEMVRENERELMREQASRDYHDELGHKLTRISLYSRRINKKLRPTANGLTEDLNSIVETSNSLQSGAKDLIWALNPKEDTLYDFTVRLKEFGNELFENTGINFTADGISYEFKSVNLSMNCKRHLIYIFKEGMNNILKYSRCSNVNLSFQMYGDDIEIILSDDGKGFDLNNCPKGYGLKNIFSRAKQINVNVNITSEDHKGTVIKLKARIPDLISV